MCVSFITLRVDYERGQFYERSSCKIIVGVVLTNYVSNLYTILLIESVSTILLEESVMCIWF